MTQVKVKVYERWGVRERAGKMVEGVVGELLV